MTADDHGSRSTYANYGCRCDLCKRAASAASGYTSSLECTGPHSADDKSFRCQKIQVSLTRAEAEVSRIARMASRSKAAFDRHSSELSEAKLQRQYARQARDEHMTECPSALERWSA